MERKYKYMPEDFEDETVREDLESVYEAIEAYKKEKTFKNEFRFDSCVDYLNLSLKHAMPQEPNPYGFKNVSEDEEEDDEDDYTVTKELRDELFEYIGNLFYD